MTVEELIKQLSNVDLTADVWIKTDDGDTEAVGTCIEDGDFIIVGWGADE